MDRIEQIAKQLKADGLDAALIMSPVGTCYLSGCYLLTQVVIPERHAYVLVTADGETAYLVCNIEERSARKHDRIADVRIYVEFQEAPAAAAARLLRDYGLVNGRIGVERHALPAAALDVLSADLPAATFVAWDEPFARALMVKSAAELDALEAAGRATQAAIERGFTGVAPGSREIDVANAILSGIMDAGIAPLFNVFTAGPSMLEAHAAATTRRLAAGEIVRVDMGGRASGSHVLSDMARTAVVGRASAAQQRVYAALYDIQQRVMDAARPGVKVSTLYRLCADRFAHHRLPFHMPHIGHGMGIGLHERPMVSPKDDTVLEPGMVLNIEPHVNVPDANESYHIEDLLVVTDGAPRYLTTPTAELIEIPAP